MSEQIEYDDFQTNLIKAREIAFMLSGETVEDAVAILRMARSVIGKSTIVGEPPLICEDLSDD